MTLRKLSDKEKQALSDLDMSKVFQELKDSGEIDTKTITIEALYNGDDLLAVTPQFDDISSLEAVSILLNVLIADARQCTDIEDFIKTIISMWGTYDETEENS
ncbi:hypothetical protein OGZ51_07405 [Lactococcus lactis]|uniref:Uncharacterized protein n=1 Tax=Lactococcus lactis TaxID=1358 RepID=A0A9X4NH24_9LACT|nr:hypothetical protein [Lactococcus lactis]MDG4983968.1 hypothetical protein [Lactococcus lactis]